MAQKKQLIYKPGSVPLRASIINLTHPTLRLTRATFKRRFTWNCSPLCARFTSLVSVAGTKHYCLTAVNRYGALCCPDFPQRAGLKHVCFSSVALSDRPINCGAVYGNRTRLLGLGSRCTTDVLTPRACIRTRATAGFSLVERFVLCYAFPKN